MGNYSEFKSRRAIARCSDKTFYGFISDIRNFNRFAGGSLAEWQADQSSCSFTVSPAGKVTVEVASLVPPSAVNYSATTALTGIINLGVAIEHIDDSSSGVNITIGLELSPFLRMMIAPQADEYLDRLVNAIETFDEY